MNKTYPVPELPVPDTSYSPSEVVSIQVDALATNDDPFENAGIGTAYNFASPGNRRATGPFDRFVRMVKGPQYAPMVDHVEATKGLIERSGTRAEQRVTLTGPEGRTVTYVFGLSEQSGGEFDDCWLTDRVMVE